MAGRLTRDGAKAVLDGAVLENNVWGRGELRNGVDYLQSIAHGDAVADGVRMTWRWPQEADGIRAYPQIFAGRKPWGPEAGGDLLPLPLDALDGLTLRYAADWPRDATGFNVAFDFWVSSDPAAGPEAITHEIMVWLRAGGLRPAGREVGRVEAGELSGALFARPDHGGGWSYLAVVADREAASGALDVGALAAALQTLGLLPREGWLMTAELGAEVRAGAGRLHVTEFALTLEAAAPPPPTDF